MVTSIASRPLPTVNGNLSQTIVPRYTASRTCADAGVPTIEIATASKPKALPRIRSSPRLFRYCRQ
jgi:hypothetical protein